jgi:hypothetical protein
MGAMFAQSTGDGIFALFGAPVAHENHPHHALFAALRMLAEGKVRVCVTQPSRARIEQALPFERVSLPDLDEMSQQRLIWTPGPTLILLALAVCASSNLRRKGSPLLIGVALQQFHRELPKPLR